MVYDSDEMHVHGIGMGQAAVITQGQIVSCAREFDYNVPSCTTTIRLQRTSVRGWQHL
jgi:hypothetical protein